MRTIGTILVVSFLLGGCRIYHKYSRPETDVDMARLYRDVLPSEDTAGMARKPWNEIFTDVHLQALIVSGLERNTDLNVAHLQTEEARAVLANARLSYLPSLNLNPQAGISHYDGETKKTYQLGASVAWELEVFGKATNAKRGAVAAFEGSQAYLQAVQTRLVATIAESYYTLLMLDAQLAIAEQTLQNWDETVRTLEALVQAGRANSVAVHQARASRTALQARLPDIRKSISETENSLSALLKEPSHRIERGVLDEQHFPADISVGLPIHLLANRPDVRQAEWALAEAFYATNAARSAFYPSLTLSGTLGWTNSGGGSIVNPGKWLSNALAQLVVPLFNNGTNKANLKIARARQEEAFLRFEQTLLDAGNEVNDALVEWQTAESRVLLDCEQIAELEAATEQTRLLVQYTPSTYLEVLTAQQSLLNAKLALAQDRMEVWSGIVHLYHAVGGGVY